MATEYGYRVGLYTAIRWIGTDRAAAELAVKRTPSSVLIAREVSEPRIVSIRA